MAADVNEIKRALPVEEPNKGYVSINTESPSPALIDAPLAIPVAPEYVIDPPDGVVITVKNEPSLSKSAVVRPDGRITYPLLGEFFIQGYTPREAEEALKHELKRFYKDELDIIVEVSAFASKHIYVVGESGPVALSFTGNQRMLDVLLAAGYVPFTGAKIGDIKVVRMNQKEPNNPKFFSINLNKLVLDGDIRQNMYLQNGDIVRVPATLIRRFTYGLSTALEPFGPVLKAATTATTLYTLKDQFSGNDTGSTTVVAPVITTSSTTGTTSSGTSSSGTSTGS